MIMAILKIFLEFFKFIIRFILDIDLLLNFYINKFFPTQYIRKGFCKKRGVCCSNLAIGISSFILKRPLYKTFVIKMFSFFYNFDLKGESYEDNVLIFNCRYLVDNQCSIHRFRPFICRRYPLVNFFGKPKVLPGCGYTFKKRL